MIRGDWNGKSLQVRHRKLRLILSKDANIGKKHWNKAKYFNQKKNFRNTQYPAKSDHCFPVYSRGTENVYSLLKNGELLSLNLEFKVYKTRKSSIRPSINLSGK